MPLSVVLLKYEFGSSSDETIPLTFAGSYEMTLQTDTLVIGSDLQMIHPTFKYNTKDETKYTRFNTDSLRFETGDTLAILNDKPLNFTAYDNGCTYSVAGCTSAMIMANDGTNGWYPYAEGSYADVLTYSDVLTFTTPETPETPDTAYKIAGIIFL